MGNGEGGWFTEGNRSVLETAGMANDRWARCDIFCKAVMPGEVEDDEFEDHESIMREANDMRLGGVLLLKSRGRGGAGSVLTFFSSDCCCNRNANCACNCIHLAAKLMVCSSSDFSSFKGGEDSIINFERP